MWQNVIAYDQLATTGHLLWESLDDSILLLIWENNLIALSVICTHEHYVMDASDIQDNCLVCPLHGACFSLPSGQSVGAVICPSLKVYETRVVDNMVQLDML